eukprot:GILJ01023923.1.p1 GENE.GILJ01023923.1~~GILJ01023923.1.p1  ORF type:complete len:151 (+),score=24.53 GILJ01023923.1:70-522(+)
MEKTNEELKSDILRLQSLVDDKKQLLEKLRMDVGQNESERLNYLSKLREELKSKMSEREFVEELENQVQLTKLEISENTSTLARVVDEHDSYSTSLSEKTVILSSLQTEKNALQLKLARKIVEPQSEGLTLDAQKRILSVQRRTIEILKI